MCVCVLHVVLISLGIQKVKRENFSLSLVFLDMTYFPVTSGVSVSLKDWLSNGYSHTSTPLPSSSMALQYFE